MALVLVRVVVVVVLVAQLSLLLFLIFILLRSLLVAAMRYDRDVGRLAACRWLLCCSWSLPFWFAALQVAAFVLFLKMND